MEQLAKIFLSEERGLMSLDWLRSYCTFNFGAYKKEHKTAVENLYVLNDDTLAGERSIGMRAEEDTLVIILPIAGAVEYKSNNNHTIVIAGQVLSAGLEENTSFTLTNPYPEALVNFVQLWIKVPAIHHLNSFRDYSFDININKNTFIKEQLCTGISLHIGKFDGRQKANIDFAGSNTTAFAFVIEGAFEVEERLLHPRDGLALWNHAGAEMEALSNDAIILFIEMN